MPSRDIWSHGSGVALRDLLRSALAALILAPCDRDPAYFCSPWLSDFVLFENHCRQVTGIFPELADEEEIRFGSYLHCLARQMAIRIVTVRNDVSVAFLENTGLMKCSGIECRFASDEFHEKSILTPRFYIEGSMNLTFSGLYIRGEKITFHVPGDAAGAAKISTAYLEFQRQWENLCQPS